MESHPMWSTQPTQDYTIKTACREDTTTSLPTGEENFSLPGGTAYSQLLLAVIQDNFPLQALTVNPLGGRGQPPPGPPPWMPVWQQEPSSETRQRDPQLSSTEICRWRWAHVTTLRLLENPSRWR